jgi:hypothetical protein
MAAAGQQRRRGGAAARTAFFSELIRGLPIFTRSVIAVGDVSETTLSAAWP